MCVLLIVDVENRLGFEPGTPKYVDRVLSTWQRLLRKVGLKKPELLQGLVNVTQMFVTGILTALSFLSGCTTQMVDRLRMVWWARCSSLPPLGALHPTLSCTCVTLRCHVEVQKHVSVCGPYTWKSVLLFRQADVTLFYVLLSILIDRTHWRSGKIEPFYELYLITVNFC